MDGEGLLNLVVLCCAVVRERKKEVTVTEMETENEKGQKSRNATKRTVRKGRERL
jgi:hypothetical protein